MIRTALITGANRGLGLEVATQLAQLGYKIFLTSRNGADASKIADRLREQTLNVHALQLDVSDPQSNSRLAQSFAANHERLDVLVNNAGVYHHDTNESEVRQTLDTNFFGAMTVTDTLLPYINDGGAIVMVSSGMGELSGFAVSLREQFLKPTLTRLELIALVRRYLDNPQERRKTGWPSSYCVSKAALNALVRILHRELRDRTIRVNAVCPGWVRTDMGGKNAPRDIKEGAASIKWAAQCGVSGGFFRDGKKLDW